MNGLNKNNNSEKVMKIFPNYMNGNLRPDDLHLFEVSEELIFVDSLWSEINVKIYSIDFQKILSSINIFEECQWYQLKKR